MSILNLTLKKKWFDLILSEEKKEEYREIKKYWNKRFLDNYNSIGHEEFEPEYTKYDAIVFRNGYAKNSPMIQIECLGISTGTAKPEWSDNWKGIVFIISLGKIQTTKYIKK